MDIGFFITFEVIYCYKLYTLFYFYYYFVSIIDALPYISIIMYYILLYKYI